jgi:hypothetical protein
VHDSKLVLRQGAVYVASANRFFRDASNIEGSHLVFGDALSEIGIAERERHAGVRHVVTEAARVVVLTGDPNPGGTILGLGRVREARNRPPSNGGDPSPRTTPWFHTVAKHTARAGARRAFRGVPLELCKFTCHLRRGVSLCG